MINGWFPSFFAKQGRLKIHDISRIVDAKAFVGFLVLYSKRVQFILVHFKEINKKIKYMYVAVNSNWKRF